jgi:hypothetical protein
MEMYYAPVEPSAMMKPSGAESSNGKHQEYIVGLPVVPQTKIAFIGYILLFVAMVVVAVNKPDTFVAFLPNMVVFLVVAALGLYVINCTVVGKCNLYAWIVSYIVVVLGIFGIAGIIMSLARK